MPTTPTPHSGFPWRIAAWSLVPILLAIPYIGMQFTDAVNWGPGDFLFTALLLIAAGLVIEFAMRTLKNPMRRITAVFAVIGSLLMIWAEMAVGIFS